MVQPATLTEQEATGKLLTTYRGCRCLQHRGDVGPMTTKSRWNVTLKSQTDVYNCSYFFSRNTHTHTCRAAIFLHIFT